MEIILKRREGDKGFVGDPEKDEVAVSQHLNLDAWNVFDSALVDRAWRSRTIEASRSDVFVGLKLPLPTGFADLETKIKEILSGDGSILVMAENS